MKKASILFLLTALIFCARAQVLKPATWNIKVSKESVSAGDSVALIFEVEIDENWYLYSTDFDPDLGPMVTEFDFEPDPSYQLLGDIIPVNAKKKYDDLWEGEYTYFTGKAILHQPIRILKKDPVITGAYAYQVCSDIDGKCIPFDDTFDFSPLLGKGTKEASVDKKEPANEVKLDAAQKEGGFLKKRDVSDPYSLLAFMVVAFLAGLMALLTPCVFPMIPMTVTFFTGRDGQKKGGKKKAFFYGFFIILIYTIIGSIVAPFMGPEIANDLATGWLPNVLFFLVFLVFALSFLGLFEINLPTGLVNKVDKKADEGGLIGVFFMAFTLVLVSFSCTGPIVGSILVESAGGLVLKPVLGMFAFSLAFALPFSFFALFPEWLSNLPKSGGWLNSVKVVLGFLELAFAFKFLSVADQAYHWGILDREVYLAIWIVIFTLLGFYFLGKIRLPNDDKLEKISVPRLMLAIVTFSFVVYLIPGMYGAPLKALAGYLPPMSTHDFNVAGMLQQNSAGYLAEADNTLCEEPKYDDFLHFPHGIKGYFDYEQAISCAREQNKPLFIDFTGHGCVNCREMEARVWSDPEVLSILKNDFVMVALYVDEKTTLPEDQWYTSSYDQKVKKTIGKQNADFQIRKFNNNAQPFYVVLDEDEELLLPPKAYDLDIENFKKYLLEAKEAYQEPNIIVQID